MIPRRHDVWERVGTNGPRRHTPDLLGAGGNGNGPSDFMFFGKIGGDRIIVIAIRRRGKTSALPWIQRVDAELRHGAGQFGTFARLYSRVPRTRMQRAFREENMFHIVTRRIAREGNAVIGANGLRHAELLENGLKHR